MATKDQIGSSLARQEDGTIQITFTIPPFVLEKTKSEVASELARDIEVPGFRKGKAPVAKVLDKIPQNSLTEKVLARILPKALAGAITKYKLKPAIYPKFELIKATLGDDWQVRAVTCELPEIDLGDYKKTIAGLEKGKGEESHSAKASRDKKEQEVIKNLLETVKIKVPAILLEEEVNTRLSNLLSRLEKLGLSLEGYLASIGKTSETLRKEYETQAQNAIALDLILNKIADEEGVKIAQTEVEKVIQVQGDPRLAERLKTPEQKALIISILRRRAALDSLVNLI